MICLGISQSRFNVATIIFYTCILIPLRQLKEALLSMFGLSEPNLTLEPFYVDLTCFESEGIGHQQQKLLEDLPLAVVRFGELVADDRTDDGESQVCSVCLVEFKRDDEVNKLWVSTRVPSLLYKKLGPPESLHLPTLSLLPTQQDQII